MRVRAIRDLVAIRDDNEFFQELSEGLKLVAENASTLNDGAEALSAEKRFRLARVVLGVAEEEAAKYLILLDAARCPRHPQKLLSRQLGYFNSHLAKGIYAGASWWRTATYDELKRNVERERASHYLDGPNDVDWIVKNQILRKREERLYVDYVENDGEHFWTSPKQEEALDIAVFSRLPVCSQDSSATPHELNVAVEAVD